MNNIEQNAYNWLNENQLSYDIWSKKYRSNNETLDEWFDRVSGGNSEIRKLIKEKKFLFGGRILANRGLNKKENRKITLSNCYVLEPPEDNIESIFDCASKLARTYSYGGGCGVDVSKLRPKGAKVNNAANSTTGTTSFMDFFSYVTGLIGQEGRRGALMLSIDCTHPDLEEFINLKSDLDTCTKANISVRVSDHFMRSVEQDADWILGFKTEHEHIEKIVKARDIFKLLAKRNWEMAEPGVLFWDRVKNYNMLNLDPNFGYAGVNPCAEEPLPAGGSCLLGSINLSEFVINAFHNNCYVDYDALEKAVAISVQALNQVLLEGMDLHPLEIQRKSVYNWRQIGLGTFGLGDMLIKLGVRYGSAESKTIINSVFKCIATTAVETSLQLAKIEGCYPMCNKDALVRSSFIKALNLPGQVTEDIEKFGLFNSQLLTCAPTGTTATMLQVSTGVEPNFAFSYNRRTVSLNDEETTYIVDADIVKQYKKVWGNVDNDELPNFFVTSQEIPWKERIEVQSYLQTWIDASISSTVNLPESTTIEEVFDLYMYAWECGLKGVTIWRDNCNRQGILTTKKEEKTEETEKNLQDWIEFKNTGAIQLEVDRSCPTCLDCIETISRDDLGQVLSGETYKYQTACGPLYITINKDSDGNIVEVFTNSSKNGTCKANLNGETRLISLALRAGIKTEEVIDTLKSIQCQSCIFSKAKGNKIDGTSCPDIMAKAIKRSYDVKTIKVPIPEEIIKDFTSESNKCPECGKELMHSGGCVQCSCGYSKCS